LWSHDEALDAIAEDAASMQADVGRQWRPLQDTTNDPIINERRPQPWRSWQRSEDYYTEGLLIWLDADSLIRETTHGQKSMNDFARAFFGVDDGQITVLPYRFEDVVKTLNDIMPFDWKTFLRTRLDGISASPPLDGITRGGYKLVYTEKPSAFLKSIEGRRKGHDYTWSVGFSLGSGGTVSGVLWNSPAFRAGLVRGSKLIAVNGISYEDSSDLTDAIKLAKTSKAPIELLVQDDRHFRTLQLDYHDGLRYPHLERVAGKPALLDDLLAALK
jgi:predicted metalloprotease with PDZ domain